MIKRVAFLMVSAILIAVSALFCIIYSEETPLTVFPVTDTTLSNTADAPSTSPVNEDVVFDKVAIIDTTDITNMDIYTDIETVGISDFEFGNYLPVVFFDTVSTAKGGYYKEYAILGGSDLEACTRSFNRIEDAYGSTAAQGLLQSDTSDIEAQTVLDALKTDDFYKSYARNSFYVSDSDGLRIVENGLNIFEITVSDGSYYRMATKNPEKYRLQIEQVIDSRYYLISVFYIEQDSYTDVRRFGAYLYDIEEETLTLLEKYAINPMLSPDMKYLIYTGQAKRQAGEAFSGINQLRNQDRGFYIKNLESSETAFYRYGNPGDFADYGCTGWISCEDYNKLIYKAPQAVTLDSTTQRFFDNTRELPEKDGNLKTVKLLFPEDFPMENYKEPELAEPKDFEFGDYMLNVSFSIGNITASYDVYTSSFLGKEINTINEGRVLFDKFNEKYMIKHPLKNIYENNGHVTPNSFLGSYLYNSRVTYISPDGKEVITHSLVDARDSDSTVRYWYSYEGWMGRTDYYFDGRVTASELADRHFWGAIGYTVNLPSYDSVYSNGDWAVFDKYFGDADIFSKSQNKWICHLDLPNEYIKNDDGTLFVRGCTVQQVIDDRYLLLDMQKNFPDTSPEYPTYSHCTYLYDLEAREYTYLGSYMFETTISPDNRYLAYQTYWWDYMPDASKNDLYQQKNGFFILDLETKKTVFYPNEQYGYQSIAGWVSKDAIDAAIAHEGSFVDPDVEQREDIVLLKSGENTKKVVFDIDPRTKLTSSLEWVNSKDFDYGKYFPFIKAGSNYNFISNISGEKTLYQRVCEKLDMPNNSELIYISEKSDKFGIYIYGANGQPDTYKLINADGTVEFQVNTTERHFFNDSDLYEGARHTGYVPPEQDHYYSVHTVSGLIMYSIGTENGRTVYIYDGTNPEPVYEIALPIRLEAMEDGAKVANFCEIESLSANGYAVISTMSIPADTHYAQTTTNGLYFVDLNSGKITPLDTRVSNTVISPDGNSIFGYVYDGKNSYHVHINTKSGEYLKYTNPSIISWVDAQSVLAFVK